MGIGVIYTARDFTPQDDGSLPRQECAQACRRAREIVHQTLFQAGIPYTTTDLDESFQENGIHDTFGFSIRLHGTAQGCMDLYYRWSRYPKAPERDLSQWNGDHYAKTQFAIDPVRTHITVCRLLQQWHQEGLLQEPPWDDLDWLQHQDEKQARQDLTAFQTDLEEIIQAFTMEGMPVAQANPGDDGITLFTPPHPRRN